MAELDRATDVITVDNGILLIEDSRSHAVICQEELVSQCPPYRVEVASTAEAALQMLRLSRFDAVVMDYNLPDMDGGELIKRIHGIKPDCPIIVITGADSSDLALDVIRGGASDYLPKFGDYHKFLPRAVATSLERAKLHEELGEMFRKIEQSSQDEALLNRMMVNIHGSLELEDIVDRATQSLADEFKVGRAIVCLLGESNNMRIVRQVTQSDLEPISERSQIFGQYHDLLLDIGERRPLVVMTEDSFPLAQAVAPEMTAYGIMSMVMVPLVYQGRLMGLLHLDQCDQARLWTWGEINLLMRIASQLSIAVSQARLYKIVETQSKNIDKLNDLCSQLNQVVSSTRELTQQQQGRETVRIKLSTREIEVLRQVAHGLSNKEIASTLHITEGTTEVHVSRLRKKLSLGSRAALVRYAYENHLS